jgi:hypothetical protein
MNSYVCATNKQINSTELVLLVSRGVHAVLQRIVSDAQSFCVFRDEEN